MSWTLRAATPEDAEAIAETLQTGFDGYRELAAARLAAAGHPLRGRGRARAGAARRAEHVGDARRGRRPRRRPRRLPPAAGLPGSAHLWQLFTAPAVVGHRHGAGAAPEAIGRRPRGLRPDAAVHAADQARARAFYEREGFEHTGWEAFEESIGLVLVEYAREPLERR